MDKPEDQSTDEMKDQQTEQAVPLSPAEFRLYNKLAVHMNAFHDHFRDTWNQLYAAASTNKQPSNFTLRQFINAGLQFCSQIDLHHNIEETRVFPVLARRMPAFRTELTLLTQHKQIHAGLEKLEAYLLECMRGEIELKMSYLKELMDTFGAVLWQHLDEEVKELGAENMRKYWTKDEMKKLLGSFF